MWGMGLKSGKGRLIEGSMDGLRKDWMGEEWASVAAGCGWLRVSALEP